MNEKKKPSFIRIILYIFVGSFALFFLIISPFILGIAYESFFPSLDSSLMADVSINIFFFFFNFFLLYFILKGNRKKFNIKMIYNKSPKSFKSICLIFVIIQSIIIISGADHFKDIIIGPQEVIIKDAFVVRITRPRQRSNFNYYIIGSINGERKMLRLIRNSDLDVKENKISIKTVYVSFLENALNYYDANMVTIKEAKIVYYKNLGRVFDFVYINEYE